jgi:hypothetical protein
MNLLDYKTSYELLVWASGEILSKPFPADRIQTHSEQLEWVRDNESEDFEDVNEEVVFARITKLAESVKLLLEDISQEMQHDEVDNFNANN